MSLRNKKGKRIYCVIAVLLMAIVMTGCEPAVGYAPNGWAKTDHIKWAKEFDQFTIEISEIGGMLHHEYSNSLITITAKRDSVITIKNVILKTAEQEYTAKLEKSELYRVNKNISDTSVMWTFNKSLPDALHTPLELQIRLGIDAKEETLTLSLTKVYGF